MMIIVHMMMMMIQAWQPLSPWHAPLQAGLGTCSCQSDIKCLRLFFAFDIPHTNISQFTKSEVTIRLIFSLLEIDIRLNALQ